MSVCEPLVLANAFPRARALPTRTRVSRVKREGGREEEGKGGGKVEVMAISPGTVVYIDGTAEGRRVPF